MQTASQFPLALPFLAPTTSGLGLRLGSGSVLGLGLGLGLGREGSVYDVSLCVGGLDRPHCRFEGKVKAKLDWNGRYARPYDHECPGP